MGEAVSAPRPCFVTGHEFQKGQGMVAGRKASTPPPQSTCPFPFSPSDPERPFCSLTPSPAIPWPGGPLFSSPELGNRALEN